MRGFTVLQKCAGFAGTAVDIFGIDFFQPISLAKCKSKYEIYDTN